MWKEHELLMLPTDKAENCLILKQGVGNKKLEYHKKYFTQDYLQSIYAKSYNLFILSNDKIENNDWCVFMGTNNNAYVFKASIIDLEDEVVHTGTCYHNLKDCKKIIATTDGNLYKDVKMLCKTCKGSGLNAPNNCLTCDRTGTRIKKEFLPQIPESFINAFVIEYNKNNKIDKVLVKYDLDSAYDTMDELMLRDLNDNIHNLSVDYTNYVNVSFVPLNKLYTFNELYEIAQASHVHGYSLCLGTSDGLEFKDWFNKYLIDKIKLKKPK